MKHLLLSASVLALCSASFAQSWSPLPKYQSEHGQGYQYYFGRYSGGRFQFADGNFRNSALVVTKISMRVVNQTRYYSDYYRMGRAWTNVQIDMAPTDLSTFGSNFSNNVASTPTQCYSGAMTWPTMSLGQSPGGLNNFPIQAPLTTPYINSGAGTDDMLMDFRFSGGTLANNLAWASRTSRYYFTDGYLVTSIVQGPQRFWHDSTTNGCVDTQARPLFYRAYTYQYTQRYSSSYRTTSYANKLRVYNYSYYIGPDTNFINAVDFAVNPAGIPLGARCEKLYLAMTPAMLIFPQKSNAFGRANPNYMGFQNGLVPFHPSFVGAELFTQSVWDDTVTGATKLTAASSGKVGEFGIESDAAAKRNCCFSNTHGPTGSVLIRFYANPILKYN